MSTVILFILILGLLVFVHEGGHFLAARWAKCKVYEFALGFPPRVFGWYKDPKTGKRVFVRRGERNKDGSEKEYPSTLYTINWLPLGGYVKIKGENGEHAADNDSFGSKPAWKRIIILCAGVAMNFVLAAVLLGVGFMVGLPTDASVLDDPQAILVGEPSVVVQQIEPESPADLAGMSFGDRILYVDGIAIESSEMLSDYIAGSAQDEIIFDVNRGEESLQFAITPAPIEGLDERPRVGVLLGDAVVVRYPWYVAIWKGLVAAVIATVNIVFAFFFLIKNLIIGQGLAFEVAGPVGIAVIIGDSARLGLNYLLNVTAMISLSLAVINILPIPALDGGRVLFVLIEKIIGRPVPMRVEQLAHTIGFMLLMLLIIVVTWRDIVGLF